MACVLHGNCLNVTLPHGHSHGGGHGHSHSHNHNSKPCRSSQLSSSAAASSNHLQQSLRKDDTVLTHGVINMHSTSLHTTHSRHNSFSKTLPNGGSLLDTSSSELNGTAAVGGGGLISTRYDSINTPIGPSFVY